MRALSAASAGCRALSGKLRRNAKPLECSVAIAIVAFFSTSAMSQLLLPQPQQSSPSQQSLPPVVGGSRGVTLQQGGISNLGLPRRHLGPTGQPCVQTGAYSRAQVINPNIYD